MIWLAAALVLAVAFYALCWWGAGIILHPPAMSPMWIFPEQFGLRYEKISFKTRDDLELKGWFIPSTTGDTRTILMCHGWGDNKGELLKQTYFLNENGGFNLMYFDFRSHGTQVLRNQRNADITLRIQPGILQPVPELQVMH